MQQLTGLDGAFLAMETSTVFGHIASICVVDPDTGDGPLTLERLTDVVASRLDLVPPFRRRLAPVPLGLDQPYWIEDPDFDIEYHVRAIALPPPGSDALLAEQAARLHARPLDRARPLWEMYLISGLAGGRMAVYTKVHHAAIDGVSGSDILAALLDTARQPDRPAAAPPPPSEAVPSAVTLLTRSALSLTQHPARAVRMSLDLVRAAPASPCSTTSSTGASAGRPRWSGRSCARRTRRGTRRSPRTAAGPSATCRCRRSNGSSSPPESP